MLVCSVCPDWRDAPPGILSPESRVRWNAFGTASEAKPVSSLLLSNQYMKVKHVHHKAALTFYWARYVGKTLYLALTCNKTNHMADGWDLQKQHSCYWTWLDGLDSLVNAGHIRSTVWTDKLALLVLWSICHQISRNGLFIIKSVGLAEQNFLKSIWNCQQSRG